MNTNLGRVVYDRKMHAFSEKDVARIVKAIAFKETPEAIADALATVYIRMVFEEAYTVEQISTMVKVLIRAFMKYIGFFLGERAFLDEIKDFIKDPYDIPGTSA